MALLTESEKNESWVIDEVKREFVSENYEFFSFFSLSLYLGHQNGTEQLD